MVCPFFVQSRHTSLANCLFVCSCPFLINTAPPNSRSSGQCLHSKPLSADSALAPRRRSPPWGKHLYLWRNCHWSWDRGATWSSPAFSHEPRSGRRLFAAASSGAVLQRLQTRCVWIRVDSLTVAFPSTAARKPFSSTAATTPRWCVECLRSLTWFPWRVNLLMWCSTDPGFM